MDFEGADERGVQGRGGKDGENVFKEDPGGGEVGVLPEGGAEGGFEDGELFLVGGVFE